jgi:hypothetical protein
VDAGKALDQHRHAAQPPRLKRRVLARRTLAYRTGQKSGEEGGDRREEIP